MSGELVPWDVVLGLVGALFLQPAPFQPTVSPLDFKNYGYGATVPHLYSFYTEPRVVQAVGVQDTSRGVA